ncbi:hypothetical protein BCV72DRAFT_302710 [Rhizopus microsporus var. microsporus]|uniref:Uncharacterized protein n=2 Tax=Rhizopus microsporus TaxID=58291 RepID=A0A2G4T9C9_RHIZD|nr:uncharacterized protein RHIMIDRAFT_233037 [Rhizopus microsporus ATCC 52813]ORE09470.1 hypothetical protein BCV72DRAFT_302710 [Rhizopus microsporus var. microsporus]PHZ17612.1 hypothetical protein RHIMIDRAFT_233037 [Rhizopus microsporus ATCC 52813]
MQQYGIFAIFEGLRSHRFKFPVIFTLIIDVFHNQEPTVETALVSRVDGKFTCPKYSSRLISPTTLNCHLGKMHGGRCSTASKRRKRLYSEMDSNDNNTVNASNKNNNNSSLSINPRQRQMRAPHLNIDEYDSSYSSIANSSLCNKNSLILLASSALSLSSPEQEKRIMLTKVGDWEAITLLSLNGKSYLSRKHTGYSS